MYPQASAFGLPYSNLLQAITSTVTDSCLALLRVLAGYHTPFVCEINHIVILCCIDAHRKSNSAYREPATLCVRTCVNLL